MATSDDSKQTNSGAVIQFHKSIVISMYWAAALLLLLAWWIGAKHWDTGAMLITLGVHGLSLAALAVAIWLTIVPLRLRQDAAKLNAELTRIRPMLGMIFLALAVALAGLLLWLGIQQKMLRFGLEQKMAPFPELSSGAALVLLGICAGLTLLAQTVTPGKILTTLKNYHKIVTIVLLFIGLSFFINGVTVFLVNREKIAENFPVASGSLLFGLVFLGGGIWQMLASPSEVTKYNIRILILVIGGAAGFVIAFAGIVYAIINRNDVFAGGLSLWQGEGAWKFWLCVWITLLGLVLMFVSLLLGYGDVRKNQLLRLVLYGYNAVFTGLLLMAVLVVLNFLVYVTFPYNYNWTESQGFYSLSDRSKNILTALKDKVTIYAIMSENSRNFADIRNLMENFQAYSSKVVIKYVSPDFDDTTYQRLQKLYPKIGGEAKGFHGGSSEKRGLLVVYGPEDVKKPEHSFILDSDLSTRPTPPHPMMKKEQQPTPPEEFKGESLVMTQITFLSKAGKKPIVYFTQSNGELDLDVDNPRDHQGGGILKKSLEDANYEVRKLKWHMPPNKAGIGDDSTGYSKKKFEDAHKVPDDAKVLVIAWPTLPFADDVLQALDDYMKGGGKMIIMSNMSDSTLRVARTNLERFAKNYGVEMKQNYLFSVSGRSLGEHSIARMKRGSSSPLANAFRGIPFVIFMGRTVQPATGGTGGYQAEVFMEVNPEIITLADNNLDALQGLRALINHLNSLVRADQLGEKQITGAVPIAVTVKDRDQKTRMVVFGAGRFASNAPIAVRGLRPPYHDVVLGSLELLEDRPESIGIAPKKSNYYRLRPKDTLARMIFLPFGLMVLFLVGMGVGIWVVRRR